MTPLCTVDVFLQAFFVNNKDCCYYFCFNRFLKEGYSKIPFTLLKGALAWVSTVFDVSNIFFYLSLLLHISITRDL